MAERRMFAKTIVLSDEFLDMPLSARCLYFTLGMFADDDGFVNSPKGIMRQCGASQDDMSILLAKKFILSFESGVIVIKHWRINNYLRSDRYSSTKYVEEKEQLSINENGSYTFGIPVGIPNSGIPSIGKDSIGKNSIDKDIKKEIYKERKSDRFVPPTVDMVKEYCTERGNNVDANEFVDFYESKGWYVGKNKMKDWKASVRTWERNSKNTSKSRGTIDESMIKVW